MQIRPGKPKDIKSITQIFNFYIEHTYARFEERPFTEDNRRIWFSQFSSHSKHQIYVVSDHEVVVGFACYQPYRNNAAFSDTVEVSIYLSPIAKGKGYGRKLYSQLFSSLKNQGIHRVLSGVALPNEASIALHKKFGFREVGVFKEYAKKNGVYISSAWLEKPLTTEPTPPKP